MSCTDSRRWTPALVHALAAPVVFAHGLADGADLPIRVPLLLLLVAATVLGVAGALSNRAARSGGVLDRQPWTRPLPGWVTTVVDHPAFRAALRVAGTLLALVVLAVAALGVDRAARNPAPRLFFVVFWGGLAVISVVLGPVWRHINPLRTVSAALARLTRDPGELAVRPVPERVGVWPAVAGLAAFVWLEQIGSDRPSAVLIFLLSYGVAHVAAALLYGQRWFAHGDAFELYSGLLGTLSPLGRDAQDRIALRNPVSAIAREPPVPGLTAAAAVLIGGNVFETLSEGTWWQQRTFGLDGVVAAGVATAALTACVFACWLLARGVLTRPFLAPALVPLIAAYALAHYLAPLIVDGQTAFAQLSDPLDRGWNLLGLTGRYASYEVVPVTLFATIQVLAFVGAHTLAVAAAHRLSVARFDLRSARALQFPLRVLVVFSAVGGVAFRAVT